MGWTTHLDAVRLDQRTWFYLWRENDVLSAGHPLVRAPSGALLHASEPDAREVARQLGEPISRKPLHTVELDAALAWSAAPQASELDAGLLMSSWHLLVDLGALASPEDGRADSPPLEDIFDKVHWQYSQSCQPGPPATPVEWTHVELGLLAATLQEGTERLRERLAALAPTELRPPAG